MATVGVGPASGRRVDLAVGKQTTEAGKDGLVVD